MIDRLVRKIPLPSVISGVIEKSLSSVNTGMSGGWRSLFVHEPFSGAWQQNKELKREDITAFYAVFSCISLISKDIGKMPILLKRLQDGVLVDVDVPEALNVIKKPNNFQTWQQFNECWTTSLLLRGNAYAFKARNVRGEVERMVILNPDQVTPLVSDDGQVFYQLSTDKLSQIESEIVPASEIIHDRINCFYHPLVGLTPVMACGLAAGMGLNIQKGSAGFFGNMSRPSGILTAPGNISEDKAKAIGTAWNANYSGQNIGKTAVLGDDLKYQPISISAADAQTIEQLKMSAEIVCSVFHVPAFKIGISSIPAGQKIADLNEIYYSDCLQSLVESRENLLDDGLDLKSHRVEAFFDLETLIRMDSASQMTRLKDGVGAAIMTPNEARSKIGLKPLDGGDTVYMQQQNYSLEALSKRDAKDDPFGKSDSPTAPNGQKSFDSLYRGSFKHSEQYQLGQFVTHKGSLWHCEKVHTGEFDHASFKLCVKGAK